MIYVFAPHIKEDLTQVIGYEIGKRCGIPFSVEYPAAQRKILVLEIGGLWDRKDPKDKKLEPEIFVQDTTRTKMFQNVLGEHFVISDRMPMNTDWSHQEKNYVRLEITNRVRYNDAMRELVIECCAQAIDEIKKNIKLEEVEASGT